MTDLKTLSMPELKKLYLDTDSAAATDLENILAEVSLRANPQLEALFSGKGKTSGDVSEEIDGVKLKYEISKRTDWDSELLKQAAQLVPPDKVNGIFDAKLSVKEATFKVLDTLLDKDNPALAKIKEARTVKLGEPKVSFVKDAA